MKRVAVSRRAGYWQGEDNECWEWDAALDKAGYGSVRDPKRKRVNQAHRVVWEMAHGTDLPPRSSGMELDHICNNRKCVNPKHLELVTLAENRKRRDARRWAAA